MWESKENNTKKSTDGRNRWQKRWDKFKVPGGKSVTSTRGYSKLFLWTRPPNEALPNLYDFHFSAQFQSVLKNGKSRNQRSQKKKDQIDPVTLASLQVPHSPSSIFQILYFLFLYIYIKYTKYNILRD